MTAMVVLWPKMKAPTTMVKTPQTVKINLQRRKSWTSRERLVEALLEILNLTLIMNYKSYFFKTIICYVVAQWIEEYIFMSVLLISMKLSHVLFHATSK